MPSKKAKANRPAGKAARSPKQDALERFREDPEGQLLTTDQGLRVNDDQNSLKAGPRGPSLHRDWGREAKVQNVPA
jgi:catalase